MIVGSVIVGSVIVRLGLRLSSSENRGTALNSMPFTASYIDASRSGEEGSLKYLFSAMSNSGLYVSMCRTVQQKATAATEAPRLMVTSFLVRTTLRMRQKMER